MRDGWEVKPLKEVCQYQRGLTYTKSDEVEYSSNIVLRANNIDLGTHLLNLSDLKYISDDVTVSQTKRVRPGSLLICTASGSKSHLGKVAFIDQDYGYAFGGFMGQITPKKEVEERFLFYVLTSSIYKKYIDELSDGVNINNLKYDQLGQFPVIVPPLPEQRRIVAILDEAFEGIATAKANAEKNLQNAREVFEGHLNAVFSQRGEGWVEKRLGDVCRRITVGHVGPMAKRYKSNGIPFLRSQNIRPFSIDLDNVVFIDEAFHSSLAKSSLEVGDIAIVRTGYPGTAAVIPESLGIANCSDLVIVRPGIDIDAHFLAAFFNSQYGKQLVLGKIVGAAQKHFNVSAAKETVIYIPPVTEQLEIIRAANEMREETQHLESLYQQKLAALDELKQSLLHQAFNGDL